MTFLYDGTRFRIHFFHGDDGKRRWSAALLAEAHPKPDQDGRIVWIPIGRIGIATCCTADVKKGLYSKETGRRLALDRALLDRRSGQAYLDRPLRKAAWAAYHGRKESSHVRALPSPADTAGARPEHAPALG